MRFLLVADKGTIETVSSISAGSGLDTEPHKLSPGAHNFGVIEAAAIIVVAKQAVELAHMMVKAYKASQHPGKITVTTPKGTVIVEGNSAKTAEDIVEELKPILA